MGVTRLKDIPGFNIDRALTSDLLGFSRPTRNTYGSIATVDYQCCELNLVIMSGGTNPRDLDLNLFGVTIQRDHCYGGLVNGIIGRGIINSGKFLAA